MPHKSCFTSTWDNRHSTGPSSLSHTLVYHGLVIFRCQATNHDPELTHIISASRTPVQPQEWRKDKWDGGVVHKATDWQLQGEELKDKGYGGIVHKARDQQLTGEEWGEERVTDQYITHKEVWWPTAYQPIPEGTGGTNHWSRAAPPYNWHEIKNNHRSHGQTNWLKSAWMAPLCRPEINCSWPDHCRPQINILTPSSAGWKSTMVNPITVGPKSQNQLLLTPLCRPKSTWAGPTLQA